MGWDGVFIWNWSVSTTSLKILNANCWLHIFLHAKQVLLVPILTHGWIGDQLLADLFPEFQRAKFRSQFPRFKVNLIQPKHCLSNLLLLFISSTNKVPSSRWLQKLQSKKEGFQCFQHYTKASLPKFVAGFWSSLILLFFLSFFLIIMIDTLDIEKEVSLESTTFFPNFVNANKWAS